MKRIILSIAIATLTNLGPNRTGLAGNGHPKVTPETHESLVSSLWLFDRDPERERDESEGPLERLIMLGLRGGGAKEAEIAIETMNTVLGDAFTARINMNLREGKHWSYGAWSTIPSARGQRPFIVYAPVQTDKTRESLIELDKELRDILGPHPPTDDELKTAQANQTLRLPGAWETISAVGDSIGSMVRFSLPDDYFTTYPGKVRALSVGDLSSAAKEVVRPENLVWVIVGDRAKIESGIRDLGWGDVQLLDADGHRFKGL